MDPGKEQRPVAGASLKVSTSRSQYNAGSGQVRCIRCAKDFTPRTRWRTHSNGSMHVEGRCPDCGSFLTWLKQSPETLALVGPPPAPPSKPADDPSQMRLFFEAPAPQGSSKKGSPFTPRDFQKTPSFAHLPSNPVGRAIDFLAARDRAQGGSS